MIAVAMLRTAGEVEQGYLGATCWGNRTNRDGPAPPVLNIHDRGRKTVPDTVSHLISVGYIL
jgi:hypothetical protein